MDRGAWWVIVRIVAKSQTQLSDFARTKGGRFSVPLLPERLSVVPLCVHQAHSASPGTCYCVSTLDHPLLSGQLASLQTAALAHPCPRGDMGPSYDTAESPLFSCMPCIFFFFFLFCFKTCCRKLGFQSDCSWSLEGSLRWFN